MGEVLRVNPQDNREFNIFNREIIRQNGVIQKERLWVEGVHSDIGTPIPYTKTWSGKPETEIIRYNFEHIGYASVLYGERWFVPLAAKEHEQGGETVWIRGHQKDLGKIGYNPDGISQTEVQLRIFKNDEGNLEHDVTGMRRGMISR